MTEPLYETQRVFQAPGEPWGTTANTEPTLTDQSGARDTDINVIVGKFGIGQVHQEPDPGMYGDFSEYPTDLRSFIEKARSVDELREGLPPELKTIPLDELLYLSPDDILAKLQPAEQPAEQTKGETK